MRLVVWHITSIFHSKACFNWQNKSTNPRMIQCPVWFTVCFKRQVVGWSAGWEPPKRHRSLSYDWLVTIMFWDVYLFLVFLWFCFSFILLPLYINSFLFQSYVFLILQWYNILKAFRDDFVFPKAVRHRWYLKAVTKVWFPDGCLSTTCASDLATGGRQEHWLVGLLDLKKGCKKSFLQAQHCFPGYQKVSTDIIKSVQVFV